MREAAAAELRSRLDRKFEEGGVEEAVLRALIYVRRPEGGFDERGYRMLKIIRESRKSNERLSLPQFREMLNEQLQLVLLDEERAVAALPKLLADRRVGYSQRRSRRCASSSARGRAGPRRRAPPRAGRETVRREADEVEESQWLTRPETLWTTRHERYEQLIAAAQKQTAIKVAVAHPCDQSSMRGVS